MAGWINPQGIWDDNWHAQQEALERGESGGGGGGGGGSPTATGIDLSQVPSVSQYVEGQFAIEDEALQDLINQMMGRERPLDIYSRLESEAGLPALRGVSMSLSKEIAAIEDFLQQIEPDVSAKTRESLVTEAQRRGMVQEERRLPSERLTRLSTALGRIGERINISERGISNKVALALQGQQMDLEPLELKYRVLVERNQRRLTGFTQDRQTQLDILFDKLQRQRQLDDREWMLANQLAQEERRYSQGLKTSAADLGIQLTGNESNDAILNAIAISQASKTMSGSDWSDFEQEWNNWFP